MFNNALRGFTDRMEYDHKENAWQTWHVAALGRASRMPSLRTLVGGNAKPVELDAAGLNRFFRGMQKRGVKVKIERVERRGSE